jgi:hypothetical protein
MLSIYPRGPALRLSGNGESENTRSTEHNQRPGCLQVPVPGLRQTGTILAIDGTAPNDHWDMVHRIKSIQLIT